MDTFKDKQLLDDIHTRGQVSWQVWKHDARGAIARPQGATKAAAPALARGELAAAAK
jgi:hypothetical protein